jgi:hypothetical protein
MWLGDRTGSRMLSQCCSRGDSPYEPVARAELVYNSAGSGEQLSARLAASGWPVLGETSAPEGYRFAGANPDGPISSDTVKADQLKVRAGKTKWGSRSTSRCKDGSPCPCQSL